jgi:hypothetical protein
MLNVLVTEIILQIIGKLVATGMPQHVRMRPKLEAGLEPGTFNQLCKS